VGRHRTKSRKPAKARRHKTPKIKRFNVRSAASSEKLSVADAELREQVSTLTNELARRTADLTESLAQQTATAEVLKVISSSPGDLQPVFEAMLEKAARICDAQSGSIYRWDGDVLHLAATYRTRRAFVESRRWSAVRPDPKLPMGRAVFGKTVVHVYDAAADEADVPIVLAHVCFEGEERKWRGLAAMSLSDPTRTSTSGTCCSREADFYPY
jgi:hypothetical protein